MAETLIADQLAGQTPGQVAALIARGGSESGSGGGGEAAGAGAAGGGAGAVLAGARRDRGAGRVRAAALDEGLAANQHIQDKALAYKAAGVPGTMDQLRVRAFLDAINGTGSRPVTSPAAASPAGTSPDAAGTDDTSRDGASPDDTGPDGGGHDGAGHAAARRQRGQPAPDGAARAGPAGRRPRTAGGAGPGNPGRRTGPAGTGADGSAGLAASAMLTIPLVTLLGLAAHPGEARGLGALDPALARQHGRLPPPATPAAPGASPSPTSRGYATGPHGCAKPARGTR